MREHPLDGILGLVVGDALGVPVEFQPRSRLDHEPVTTMRGYGTYDQPPGTWSDDSSMTLCLVESLCEGFDLDDQAKKYVGWLFDAEWTPHGEVFDFGIATERALTRLRDGVPPVRAGGRGELDNGNGSLMRLLPLTYFLLHEPQPLPQLHDASSLTHAHPRSLMACGFFFWVAKALIRGDSPEEAYAKACAQFSESYTEAPFVEELPHFERLLGGTLAEAPRAEIHSSGYVMHTLEAALWCLLNTTTYRDCVLLAVNLGEDTDTTAAVVGGLAGILYGRAQIPSQWLDSLAKREEIEALCLRFQRSLSG